MKFLARAFSLAAIVALSFHALAQPMTAEQRKTVLDAVADTISKRAFVPGVDFSKWGEFIGKRQEEIDKTETIPAFTGLVNQALREFGFSHIRLQTPRQAARRGQVSTIGMGVGANPHESGLLVRTIAEECPAKSAGLAVGDIIVKVDGSKPADIAALEGEVGQRKRLEILRGSETKELEVELQRVSTVRKETLTWIGEDSAVLKVFTFSAGYDRANIEALMKEAAKAKNFILDLRSNGGGASNNLNHLLSLLLPSGSEYGVFVSRRMTDEYVKANPEKPITPQAIAAWTSAKTKTREREVKPYEGKVAVLINRGSASASEIVGAALQELKGAKLVGAKSAGAVLASTFIRLPEGFSIQIPVSDYITIKGRRLEANPLVPDAEITERPKEGEVDPAIKKAIELLGG